MFYVEDLCDSRQSVVLQGRKISISNHIGGSSIDVSEMPCFYQQMPFINGEDQDDVVHANRIDHDEGLWENIHMQLLMFLPVINVYHISHNCNTFMYFNIFNLMQILFVYIIDISVYITGMFTFMMMMTFMFI